MRSCNHYCISKAIGITYSECMFSLSYPACNGHALYCHLWPARLYNILPHNLINGKIFEKKKNIDYINVCFDFRYSFSPK